MSSTQVNHSIISPYLTRDLRKLLRKWKSFLTLFLFLLVLCCVIASGWSAIANAWYTQRLANFSRNLFIQLINVHLVFTILFVPFLFASVFAEERQNRTIELLLSSPVSIRYLVLSKLAAPILYIFLLLTAAMPILSLCLIGGGLSYGEILTSYCILLTNVVVMGSMGLFCSTLRPRVYETYLICAGMLFLYCWIILFHWHFVQFLSDTMLLAWNTPHRTSDTSAIVGIPFFTSFATHANPFYFVKFDLDPYIQVGSQYAVNNRQGYSISMYGKSYIAQWEIFLGFLASSAFLVLLFLWGTIHRVQKLAAGGFLPRSRKKKIKPPPSPNQNILFRDLLYRFSPEVAFFEHNPCLFLERRIHWFARSAVLVRVFYGTVVVGLLIVAPFAAYVGGSWLFFTIPIIAAIIFTLVFASTGINAERDRGTLDLLVTTMIPTRHIVEAKFKTNFYFCFFFALALFLPGMFLRLYLAQLGGFRFPRGLQMLDAILLFSFPFLLFYVQRFSNALTLYLSTKYRKAHVVSIFSILILLAILWLPLFASDLWDPRLMLSPYFLTYLSWIVGLLVHGFAWICPVMGFMSLVPPEQANQYGISTYAESYVVPFQGIPITSYVFFIIQGLIYLLIAYWLVDKTARAISHHTE